MHALKIDIGNHGDHVTSTFFKVCFGREGLAKRVLFVHSHKCRNL